MDTKPKLLLKEEVYQIVGAGMEVLNELGHGLNEKAYENALVVEFNLRGISYRQQPNYHVFYKGYEVGSWIPDLVAFENVVVELKTIDCLIDMERGQILNYLKVTKLHVGVIMNFKHPKL